MVQSQNALYILAYLGVSMYVSQNVYKLLVPALKTGFTKNVKQFVVQVRKIETKSIHPTKVG